MAVAKTVKIPACQEHAGVHAMTVTVPWVCLFCGGPRGEPFDSTSWDGSRRLAVHGWRNPCGHNESYAMVREAIAEAEEERREWNEAQLAVDRGEVHDDFGGIV